MIFSPKTEEAMTRFAKEAIKNSLDKSELSYFERLELKAKQLQEKTKKSFGTNREEETAELTSYMRDYMEQLINEEGLSETDAFAKAKAVFQIDSSNHSEAEKKQERLSYYENLDPATEEAIGLSYASRMFLGTVIGAVLGIFGQIFYDGAIFGVVLWIMLGLGLLFGLGLGMASHAKISKSRIER